MSYVDTIFNESGKIATDSNFWDGPIDDFVTSDGITAGFGRVIAEQTFKPIDAPSTPFYNRITGRPLNVGMGWTERAVNRKAVKHFNPKATAQDAMGFYDSDGIEKTFVNNIAGWIPNSLPSELATAEMMLENQSVGQLNAMLVDIVIDAYQQGIEADIQKYAVSMTKNKINIDFDTDVIDGFTKLMDLATAFMGDEVHYNELTEDENAGIYTHANAVDVYLPKTLMNKYRNAKASLPSPNELVTNVNFIEMVNDLATPITTTEWDKGRGEIDGAVLWDNKPVAIDEAKPYILMCDSRKFEYRPYKGTYKVGMHPNYAGDFDTMHMVFKGALAVKPWYNAVRIYNVPEN